MTDQNNVDKPQHSFDNPDELRIDESHLDDTEGSAERGYSNESVDAEGSSTEDQGSGRPDAEKLGEQAMKFASETAYAAAGFANVVADKAKAFFETQRAQYAETHPGNTSPGAKQFLDQLSEQVNKLVEDASRGYKEMAERGRTLVNKSPMAQPKDGKGPFDVDDDPTGDPFAEPANATTEVPLDVDESTEETIITDVPTVDGPEGDREDRHF